MRNGRHTNGNLALSCCRGSMRWQWRLACAANVPFWDKRLTRTEVAVLAALFRARLDWWQSNLSDEELENIRQMYLGPVTC